MSDLLDRYKEADASKEKRIDMGKLISVGITALILINVILLCSCVALYIIKENEIEKRVFSEKELKNLTIERDKLVKELDELKDAKIEIELRLALKEKDFQNLQEKFNSFRVETSLVEGEKSILIKKLSSTQEELLRLKEDFENLQQTKEILEEKLKKSASSSSVKLETIVVEPKDTKETVKGEILAVNRDYEFLVINLGLKDRLTPGSEISIYRGAELVARGKVERVYENISAVAVNDKEQLGKVQVGDSVIWTIKKSKDE